METRYDPLKKTFSNENALNLHKSKVLCVGAGGIGCEVLKGLVLSGFLDIEVVDLDTIDVSNLNRQFLFRQHHIGKSKAETAAAAAMAFNPEAKIVWHHGNVKDPKFGIGYVSKFRVVLNALDNVDARRHMNRLCLAAQVPLIDSGTTGYLGQVMPIIKGKTACYECKPKPTQKVYPICTIRSTPDKPVHCIVWAKECFKLVFGSPTESMLFEDEESTGSSSAYMSLLDFPVESNQTEPTSTLVDHISKIILAVFNEEVARKIQMGTYKSARSVPSPMNPSAVTLAKARVYDVLNGQSKRPSTAPNWERKVMSDEECCVEMILCVLESEGVKVGSLEPSIAHRGSLSFDKDDKLSMLFVATAACVRSRTFNIETKCYHDAKGIAGNIIPAIATTNAIVAGLQVMAAVKFLNSGTKGVTDLNPALCPHTYCLRKPTRKGMYLQPTEAEEPSSSCFVCGTATRHVYIDTTSRNLKDFIQQVLKTKLGFNSPAINIGNALIYEEAEDDEDNEDFTESAGRLLQDVPGGGIRDGTQVDVDDDSQDMKVRLIFHHVSSQEFDEEKVPDAFEILTDAEAAMRKQEGDADARPAKRSRLD